MRCPSCKGKNSNDAKFCQKCGAGIVRVTVEEKQSIGDLLLSPFEWILENWPVCLFGLIFLGILINAAKDIIKGFFK